MAVTSVDVLHGILTPSSFYSQVEDCTPAARLKMLMAGGAGHPSPLFAGVQGADPVVDFRTSQLATLLAECTSALNWAKGMTSGNIDLYYRPISAFGTRASLTAGAKRFRFAKAFMYVKSITLGHQTQGSADVSLVGLSADGTTTPLAVTGSQTPETGSTASSAEHFGLGPVEINNVAIEGLQSAQIDFGLDLVVAGSNSGPFPTFVGVRSVAPVITLTGLSADAWVSYGLGTALTGLKLFGRKVNADTAGGAAYVADATAAHLLFSGSAAGVATAAGMIALENTSGGGNSEVKTALKLYLRSIDTTKDPLSFGLSAIS